MHVKKVTGILASIALAVLILIGCGGGGTIGNAVIGIFVADDLHTGYSQAWGTIYKVELVGADTSTTTVFEDANGKVFNFNSLSDSTGPLFSFLGTSNFNRKIYSGMKVTMADTMTLVPTGSTNGTTYPIDGTAAGTGKVTVSFNFTAEELTNDDKFVIDFDMSNFSLVAGHIVPSLRKGDETGLDDTARHERDDVSGVVTTVSGTAPDITFDMTIESGRILTVVCNANTVIFNSDASASPTLSLGKKVEVYGLYDVVAKQYLADRVKIKVGQDGDGHHDRPQVKGIPTKGDDVAGTFDVTINEAEHFIPTDGNIHVETNESTVYRDHSGLLITKAEFFAAFVIRGGSSVFVEVEGTYNSDTNTLTALKAKLETESGGGGGGGDHEVEAKGTLVNYNSTSSVFSMHITEFEGFSFGGGNQDIAVDNKTTYEDDSHNTITLEQFVAALAVGGRFEVRGTFSEGKILAMSLKIDH